MEKLGTYSVMEFRAVCKMSNIRRDAGVFYQLVPNLSAQLGLFPLTPGISRHKLAVRVRRAQARTPDAPSPRIISLAGT